jgi:succinylglutamate desuccinylase
MTHKNDFIYTYDSGKPGENLVIMSGIHGDEVGGIYAFYWLRDIFLPKNPILKGKLTLILANLRAAELNKRCADTDMNRVFDREKGDEYEVRRVQAVKKAILGADFVLDLHSTSRPSLPMTCSENSDKHLKICLVMPVKYMITNWEGRVIGMTSDGFADKNGGCGVTLECGQHLSPDAKETAKKGALNFLKINGLIDGKPEIDAEPTEIYLFETFYPVSENFTFTVQAESFTEVKKGEIYGKDGNKVYTAQEDCVLVMPNKIIKPGTEAGYLGRIIRH